MKGMRFGGGPFLVETAEGRRHRKVFLDQVVEGVVVDVYRLHHFAGQRVLPFAEHFAAAQVGVQDDFAAQALDCAVGTLDQADGAKALRADQVHRAFAGLDRVDVALEPEVLLLAPVGVALDARVGHLVALAGAQVEEGTLDARALAADAATAVGRSGRRGEGAQRQASGASGTDRSEGQYISAGGLHGELLLYQRWDGPIIAKSRVHLTVV
jgi:hypothetical protein